MVAVNKFINNLQDKFGEARIISIRCLMNSEM
jgi:hypothetical protein